MLDVVKTLFELANNGWLGAVLLTLSTGITFILVVILKRQRVLLGKTKRILDKTVGFDTLNSEFKNFSEEIDKSFVRVHRVIDQTGGRHEGTNLTRHEQVTREHDHLTQSANLIAKDLAEIKGMFNSVMAGMRIGIK